MKWLEKMKSLEELRVEKKFDMIDMREYIKNEIEDLFIFVGDIKEKMEKIEKTMDLNSLDSMLNHQINVSRFHLLEAVRGSQRASKDREYYFKILDSIYREFKFEHYAFGQTDRPSKYWVPKEIEKAFDSVNELLRLCQKRISEIKQEKIPAASAPPWDPSENIPVTSAPPPGSSYNTPKKDSKQTAEVKERKDEETQERTPKPRI